MLPKLDARRILPAVVACLFMINAAATAGAATLIWSGRGADNLASNPVNWTGVVSPQSGDAVIFDSTPSNNCTWDLNITLSSFNIGPGYAGAVTIDAGVTVDNGFTWTGEGSDNLASNPSNWSGDAVPKDGDNIDFDGMKDCLWDLDISPAFLRMGPGFTGLVTLITDLSIAGGLSVDGGFLTLNNKALRVDGDLLIGLNGTFYAASSVIYLKGDWINKGTYDSGISTVILNGANQTVYDNNTFYNLVKKSDSADTLYFEAGSAQTILNNLILKGTAGNLLFLRSTVSGKFWHFGPGSTRDISYADIRDMKNVNQVGVAADNSINSGNNGNVHFDIDQCI